MQVVSTLQHPDQILASRDILALRASNPQVVSVARFDETAIDHHLGALRKLFFPNIEFFPVDVSAFFELFS